MPWGFGPDDLLAILQELQQQGQQPQSFSNPYEGLLMSGTVPAQQQQSQAPVTGSPFNAMDPRALAQLEQKLSAAANASAGMNEAAYLSNRPDIFLQQAQNQPETAPIALQKAGATTQRAGAEEQARQFEEQQYQLGRQEENQIASNMMKEVDPDVAVRLARTLTSGEGWTNADLDLYAQSKYQKEKKAYDATVVQAVTTGMKGYKVKEPDGLGGFREVTADLSKDPKTGKFNHPQHVEQYLAQQQNIRDQYAALEPQLPQRYGIPEGATPTTGAMTEGKIVWQTDPTTGKKTARNIPPRALGEGDFEGPANVQPKAPAVTKRTKPIYAETPPTPWERVKQESANVGQTLATPITKTLTTGNIQSALEDPMRGPEMAAKLPKNAINKALSYVTPQLPKAESFGTGKAGLQKSAEQSLASAGIKMNLGQFKQLTNTLKTSLKTQLKRNPTTEEIAQAIILRNFHGPFETSSREHTLRLNQDALNTVDQILRSLKLA